MAMGLVLAITTYREICGMRKSCEHIQSAGGIRVCHLGTVLPFERRPLCRCSSAVRSLHRLEAGREIRKPDVVPILGCELGLRYAAGRTTNRSNAQTLVLGARAPEPHDVYRHTSYDCFVTVGLHRITDRAGRRSGWGAGEGCEE